MQIQISWLLKMPIDLDLHCLQRQGISGFSRTRVNDEDDGFTLLFRREVKVVSFWRKNVHNTG